MDGSVCADRNKDKVEIQNFYQQLYTSRGSPDATEVLSHVRVHITPEMNSVLDGLFTPEDVHKALFQMAPSKAPGVDGFTTVFFSEALGIITS